MYSTWTTGTAGDVAALSATTSWYTPTLNVSATGTPTTTASYNATLASLLVAATQYCWFTDADWTNGVDEDDYPAGCTSLIETYCYVDPDAPVPTSPVRIPAVCTPDDSTYVTAATSATTTTSPAGATPTPVQPGMIAGCQKFYKVISGDTCQGIADALLITLEEVSLFHMD